MGAGGTGRIRLRDLSCNSSTRIGHCFLSGKAHSQAGLWDPLPPGSPCPTAPNLFPALSPPFFLLVHALCPFSILLRRDHL